MNNTLYILCGLPYAGKTTLRKELVKRFGFSFVSIDEIMQKHGMWDKKDLGQKDWDLAYFEGYEELKKLLKDGKNVIFDLGNLKLRQREVAKQAAKSLGVRYKLIYVNTSKEEIVRRRSKNEKMKERDHIKDWLFEKSLNMFEEPTPSEDPIIYNSAMNLENWIRENIS